MSANEPNFSSKRFVRVSKFCEETGYSDDGVRCKIRDGVWLLNTHYIKAPDRTIHMEMGAYYKWLQGEKQSA